MEPVACSVPIVVVSGSAARAESRCEPASQSAGAVRRWRSGWRWAAALLLVYAAMALTAARHEGATFDEPAHIGGGYDMWLNRDFRMDAANGDFVKRWAALPLLIGRPAFPPKTDPDWRSANFFAVGRKFLFESGNDVDAILFEGRCMVLVLAVGLGALVFGVARRLWGDAGGLVALALFAFSPDFLAYGALISTDVATALGFFAATWFAWRLLHRATWGALAGSVSAAALLVTTKLSALLIVPIVAVLIVVRAWRREPWIWCLGRPALVATRGAQLVRLGALMLVHLVVAWGALWAVYDFTYAGRPAAEPGVTFTPAPANASPLARPAAVALAFCRVHRVLPEAYLAGAEGLAGIGEKRPSFMNGHWQVGGRRSFFPFSFVVKTPPAVLVLIVLGCVAASRWTSERRASSPRRAGGWYDLTPCVALIAIYGGAAVVQNLNIGHRHLLPIYPPLFVVAGTVAAGRSSRRATAAIGVLLAWAAADSLWARPHYLAYFNGFAGGPAEGYRRLVDSSLDWGQDLPELARWLGAHRDISRPTYLAYFGTDRPESRGIDVLRLPGFPDWRDREVFAYRPGCFAISATLAQSVYTPYFGPWNRAYEDEYQAVVRQLGLNERNTADSDALIAQLQRYPETVWQSLYARYEQLRFARLCGWLRASHRAPDATAGYSILIWNLDAAALHQALWLPPVELYPVPATERREGE